MTNEVITLVKDTSLAFVVAVSEMFTIAKQIASAQTTMMPFVIAAVFYFVFNLLVAIVMDKIEKDKVLTDELTAQILDIANAFKKTFQ